MLLASFLDAKTIYFEHQVVTKEQVYHHLVEKICRSYQLPSCGNKLYEMILARDAEASTAYSSGIAIPHVRMDGFDDTLIGICFLEQPIDCAGTLVSWIALIISDKSSSKLYLNLVAALLKLSLDKEMMARLFRERDPHGVVQSLKKAEIKIKEDLRIQDIMVSNPVTIHSDEKLTVLSRLFNESGVSFVPVVDDEMGFLGEVNMLNYLKVGVPDFLMMMDNINFLKSFEPLENLFQKEDVVVVKEIMTTEVKTVDPSASIIEVVFEMIQHQKRYLSVVEKGKLVGIVTAMDIFKKVIKA
ncbi:MAG: hypothetical protein CVU48_08005 [Candidatus Cloacimonetes bacterium HGW-Cloacimonetes-1]|jgi:PTS system nitrogen regulatory IIA component|nr:MAG: hypothetical protein CVU48_08005 [Candidatus Cloacimonetes bacterium HGW-Cloacimonetes-1]